jgi:hypothetical protein
MRIEIEYRAARHREYAEGSSLCLRAFKSTGPAAAPKRHLRTPGNLFTHHALPAILGRRYVGCHQPDDVATRGYRGPKVPRARAAGEQGKSARRLGAWMPPEPICLIIYGAGRPTTMRIPDGTQEQPVSTYSKNPDSWSYPMGPPHL